MIVVRIELHSAVTGKVTEIGKMLIANRGGNAHRGDYAARVLRRQEIALDLDAEFREWEQEPFTREGTVFDYPRLSYNVWRLVSRALRSAFPEEK